MFSQPQVSLPQLLKCVQILSGFQELHSQPVSPHSHHCHPLMLVARPEHGQGQTRTPYLLRYKYVLFLRPYSSYWFSYTTRKASVPQVLYRHETKHMTPCIIPTFPHGDQVSGLGIKSGRNRLCSQFLHPDYAAVLEIILQ